MSDTTPEPHSEPDAVPPVDETVEAREPDEASEPATPARAPRRATYEPSAREKESDTTPAHAVQTDDVDDADGAATVAPVASASHISGSADTGQSDPYERADTTRTETLEPEAAQPATEQQASEQQASEEPPAATHTAPQAMYVAAPEPPKRKGNRGAGILIALVATAVYAIISALVVLVTFFFTKSSIDVAMHEFIQYIGTASYFVPMVFFFLAFILLVAIVNRGGWWAYVLGAFFVGVVVYFAYIGGVLLTVQAWNFSPGAVGRIVAQLWANPLTIGAAIVAREVPIWFGAWIARRGKKVRERNDEAQREHDRQLAAGPQPISRGV